MAVVIALGGVVGIALPTEAAGQARAVMLRPTAGNFKLSNRGGSGPLFGHSPNEALNTTFIGGGTGVWAVDFGAAGGAPVYAKFSASGAVTLKVAGVRDLCPAGATPAGLAVQVDVSVDGVWIGSVLYQHVADVAVTANQWYANDVQLGTVWSGAAGNQGCWTGPHIHAEFRAVRGGTCWSADLESNATVAGFVPVGAMGDGVGNARTCTADDLSSDLDNDGIPDANDRCPTIPGQGNTAGCPPEEYDVSSSPGDVNGDGRTDVVAFYNDGGGDRMTASVFYGTPTGLSAPTLVWDSNTWAWWPQDTRFVSGDVNGDGRTDVVAFYNDGGGDRMTASVFYGTPTGLSAPTLVWDSNTWAWWPQDTRFVSGDVNGDGRTDVVAFYNDGGGDRMTASVFYGTPTGLSAPTLVWDSNTWAWWPQDTRFVSGDVNGDGRTDVVAFYNDGGGGRMTASVFYGTPTGLSAPTLVWDSNTWAWWPQDTRFVSGDVNGDGRTDVVAFYNDGGGGRMTASVFYGTPTGLSAPTLVWDSNTWAWWPQDTRFVSGDVNGDGRTDVVAFYNDGGGGRMTASVFYGTPTGLSAPTLVWDSNTWAWWPQDTRFVSGGMALPPPAPPASSLTAGVPGITGAAVVGATLTANPGAWTPSDVTISYQWYRAGQKIADATHATYTATPDDLKKNLTVRITGSKTGFDPMITVSAKVSIGYGMLTPGTVSLPPSSKVGDVLVPQVAGWPVGITPTFTWLRAGSQVATGPTYTLAVADLKKNLVVRAAVRKDGYLSATGSATAGASSNVDLVSYGVIPDFTPTVVGPVAVGATLSVAGLPALPVGGMVGYQWVRAGMNLSGPLGTAPVYHAVANDLGKNFVVKLSIQAPGYAVRTGVSEPVAVAFGTIPDFTPRIAGPAAVGGTLSVADLPALPLGGSISYQWTRAGTNLAAPLGTGPTYRVVEGDYGKNFVVKVSIQAPGYTTQNGVSARRAITARM